MSNISILDKADCCGCTACYATCPVDAITMQPDEEGFLYPYVNQTKCIDCNRCLEVCYSVAYYTDPQTLFACFHKDEQVRERSSSGGCFAALANVILESGGGVAAVGYSADNKECLHKIVTSVSASDLDDLQRSKFVQSKKYDVFCKIQDFLNTGKTLLFVGTPCEVNGLRSFLDKEYVNLLTCDLICGCVSSPKVYRKYIDFLENKYRSSVVSVNFKDKRHGWHDKTISINFANGTEYCNSILDDDYCVSFHSRYNIRPSCFRCKCRSLLRVSDITLGDFWAIEKYKPEYDDNLGTSFLLCNTPKGRHYLAQCTQLASNPLEINVEDYASKFNWCLHKNPYPPSKTERTVFYKDVELLEFDEMSKKDLQIIKEERKRKKLKM
jgi:coenzyme F420-reducing hydrogenase beta subunit